MSNLKFGWSEVSITPDKKISLAGQFAERISEYVEKPITVTALAIESGADHVVMASVDLGAVSTNLMEAVRQRLVGNTVGLNPDKVMLSAIHTHTGPVYQRQNSAYKVLGKATRPAELLKELLPAGKKYVEQAAVGADPNVMNPVEMLEFLVDRISTAIMQAWENRAPGGFQTGFGRAVVGLCRRATYSDGSAKMWGDTNTVTFEALEGGNDSGIELMYIFDDREKLTGIIANLACPAQCVQHRLFVSPDFWGEVKVLLRQRFGEEVFLLAQCSAAGDQCPVDLIRWVEPESAINDPNCEHIDPPKRKADPSMFDLSGMRKTGRRIAREIIDVYEEDLEKPVYEASFAHHVYNCQLPLRRVTPQQAEQAKRAIEAYLRDKDGDVDYIDAAKLQVHMGILRRVQLQEKLEVLDTEVHILRLGNVAFASNPFELFLDYGNQIKARSLAEQTFLVQLCNGADGYLPTLKAEQGGHYSAYVSSGMVGHIGGEQLVRQTVQYINKIFK